MMKPSIITVCLNTVDTIEKTIQSVVQQTYGVAEYVIIDGASTDGTLEIIKNYLYLPYIKLISEKDTGLYNAMNKGIMTCSGDYILFLNSGDVLYDMKVLETVSQNEGADILYGNVVRIFSQNEIIEKYRGKHTVMKLLLMGKMPCHQGMFAKREILKEYKFDESYKICADYDFLIRCCRNKCSMQYMDVIVSEVDCVTGISSQHANLDKMRKEDDQSLKANFPFWYHILYPLKVIVRASRQLRFNRV